MLHACINTNVIPETKIRHTSLYVSFRCLEGVLNSQFPPTYICDVLFMISKFNDSYLQNLHIKYYQTV